MRQLTSLCPDNTKSTPSLNEDSTVSIESASLYSLYDTVDKLRSSIVKDGYESDSTGSASGNNNKRVSLRLAAGDVVKEVEKLVPSGSNSFSEWGKSMDNEN